MAWREVLRHQQLWECRLNLFPPDMRNLQSIGMGSRKPAGLQRPEGPYGHTVCLAGVVLPSNPRLTDVTVFEEVKKVGRGAQGDADLVWLSVHTGEVSTQASEDREVMATCLPRVEAAVVTAGCTWPHLCPGCESSCTADLRHDLQGLLGDCSHLFPLLCARCLPGHPALLSLPGPYRLGHGLGSGLAAVC